MNSNATLVSQSWGGLREILARNLVNHFLNPFLSYHYQHCEKIHQMAGLNTLKEADVFVANSLIAGSSSVGKQFSFIHPFVHSPN